MNKNKYKRLLKHARKMSVKIEYQLRETERKLIKLKAKKIAMVYLRGSLPKRHLPK